MTNAIISGGAGFIGSNFVRTSVENNWFNKILIVDKLNYAANKSYLPSDKNVTLEVKDLSDTNIDELEDADIFYNFAAETHVDNAINDSLIFSQSNYLSVHRLIEKIRKNSIEIKFVQISTDEVYGSTIMDSFSETANVSPRNPYAATKAAADLLLLSYVNTYDMDFIITRSSNNYGPNQFIEKLVPKTIMNFLYQKPIGIYGSGNQVRDWTYVKDNCYGVYQASMNGKKGEIYNIASNYEMTNISIIDKIAELMDVKFEYLEFVSDRPGHDFRYSIDTTKIRRLGWNPLVNVNTGLADSINWYTKKKKLFEKFVI